MYCATNKKKVSEGLIFVTFTKYANGLDCYNYIVTKPGEEPKMCHDHEGNFLHTYGMAFTPYFVLNENDRMIISLWNWEGDLTIDLSKVLNNESLTGENLDVLSSQTKYYASKMNADPDVDKENVERFASLMAHAGILGCYPQEYPEIVQIVASKVPSVDWSAYGPQASNTKTSR